MSGINTIRRLTDTDTARLEAAAIRFAARHGLGDVTADEHTTAHFNLETLIECDRDRNWGDKRLARLWQACFCRALGFKPDADLTIGWGYVGTRV